MVAQIQENDLTEYVQQYYNVDSIREIDNNGVLFEALSEVIVDKNENYKCKQLMKEYTNNGDINNKDKLHEFVESKFNQVLSHDVQYIISIADKNKWVKYTKEGMIEYYHKR